MSHATEPEHLLSGHAGRLLLSASIGWGMVQAGRLVLSPLLPTVIEDFAISPFQAGLALTTLWGLYALFQYPSGRLSDHLSRKTLLVSGLALLLVGFASLASAPTYPLFLLGAAVVGTGAGLYPTPARALVSDLYVERRGEAFGLHTASGDAGGALAAGLAVAALAVGVWQAAYLPVIVALGVVLLALHYFSDEPYTTPAIDGTTLKVALLDVVQTGARLTANARMRWLLVAYMLYAFVWQSATGFLPTLLQETKGFSPAFAGGGFAALFVVGALVKPLAGSLGDRFARASVAVGALVVASLALASLLFADGPLFVALAVGAFAAGLMAYPPVMQAYLMDTFPDASMGGDLGATRTIYIGVGSLGPTYVGFVAERASYVVAFWGLLACLLASAGLILFLVRRPS